MCLRSPYYTTPGKNYVWKAVTRPTSYNIQKKMPNVSTTKPLEQLIHFPTPTRDDAPGT